MSWSPSPDGLARMIESLKMALSPDMAMQREVMARLEGHDKEANGESTLLLTYILVHDGIAGVGEETRSVAGLLLKNRVRMRIESIEPQVLDYVKARIFDGLHQRDPLVRGTVGSVISTILKVESPANWPQGLQKCVELTDSTDATVREGAYASLVKVCQDCSAELDGLDFGGQKPLEYLIPKLIAALDTPVRVHAIQCLNQFLVIRSDSIISRLDTFVPAIFAHGRDPSPIFRKQVCQALVMCLEAFPATIVHSIEPIIAYMLERTSQDGDESVQLEACEFWLTFAEQDGLMEILRKYLHLIIPTLLKGMVYSEMDLLTLDQEDEDGDRPDKESEIRPQHHQAQKKQQTHHENGKSHETKAGRGDEVGDDDDDDYDDDDESDEVYAEWNLRKCSAAALDALSTMFHDDMLEYLLPLLKQELWSDQWTHRECGILALGAIAEGCMSGIEPHLPVLLPLLLQTLDDKKPLVRSIACWTIGRYSAWTVQDTSRQLFLPVLQGLMKMIMDRNKRVQEAGCSAFATFEEEAGLALVPYLEPVLQSLMQAFNQYQAKNLVILYDAIGTLADGVGSELNRPELITILLPPLIGKWHSIPNNSPDLFPLLETMASVTVALGSGFIPFAQPVYERCHSLVCATLQQAEAMKHDPSIEEPDKDFIIVSLDLISGLVQGVQTAIEEHARRMQPDLMNLVQICVQDELPQVRQSAFALLGDLSVSLFPLVQERQAQLMPLLTAQISIDPIAADNVAVCNNAVWALGEISLRLGAPTLQPWIPTLVQRLIQMIMDLNTAVSLLENSAVTLGRIGSIEPKLVAEHLAVFAARWCSALCKLRDNEEKDSAFRGFCAMVHVNPHGLANDFYAFAEAVAYWQTPSAALNADFAKIMTGFKEAIPEWEQYTSNWPPAVRSKLKERYGV